MLERLGRLSVQGLLARVITDGGGNPLRDTAEQREAWSTWSAAPEITERALVTNRTVLQAHALHVLLETGADE